MSSSQITSCQILWSTQSGRAKACARRVARILQEQTTVALKGGMGAPFDEMTLSFVDFVSSDEHVPRTSLIIMFVSTTGDGEQCDTIRETWKALLQKSLPANLFQEKQFALFCLGDRAYGPQFCAAGRKLAVRLMQLGMQSACDVGYGDDNTPNGGVFRDMDTWLEEKLLPILKRQEIGVSPMNIPPCPYLVHVEQRSDDKPGTCDPEWRLGGFQEAYQEYFMLGSPVTAYNYNVQAQRLDTTQNDRRGKKSRPLLGTIQENKRITASDWEQDTRHFKISISADIMEKNRMHTSALEVAELPYQAGDVASILPFNSEDEVNRFIAVLPEPISSVVDCVMQIDVDESLMDNRFTPWPRCCSLRGWLTYCADIHSLPEREDLRALSHYCSHLHKEGKDHSEKLKSLSETSEAALYADYILREKRSWADVLYDFESLRSPGSRLTIGTLLMLLPPMRPRDFSIASSPRYDKLWKSSENNMQHGKVAAVEENSFSIELCVAIVEGTTRLGRNYHGLCSKYLSGLDSSDKEPPLVQVWIRPGSFGRLPLNMVSPLSFETPILCVGAGTGIAPMRSLILERCSLLSQAQEGKKNQQSPHPTENILVFGCRRQSADYYYKDEWQDLIKNGYVWLLTAFSRDQVRKIYVQKILREGNGGNLIADHILQRGGAIYIAGGPRMARGVKEEIVEVLSEQLGGEKEANRLLNKLQRAGRFSVEAWS
jgi:sulfite reductase alpha subunit-like flavoprotein